MRLPIYIQGLIIGLTLFAIFNFAHQLSQQKEAEKTASAATSQQQLWCREFATRDDCTVVMHGNIQCPYKKIANTFKMLDPDTCREFADEYAQLQQKVAAHKNSGKALPQSINIRPNIAPSAPRVLP